MVTTSRVIVPTTILINTAISSPIYIASYFPTGLSVEFPATWTNADLIIEVNREHARRDKAAVLTAGGWTKLRDAAGAIIELTAIPTAAVSILSFATATNREALRAIQNYSWLRFRSVTVADSTIDQNQAAERILRVGLVRE